jgi:hypothetical protein
MVSGRFTSKILCYESIEVPIIQFSYVLEGTKAKRSEKGVSPMKFEALIQVE